MSSKRHHLVRIEVRNHWFFWAKYRPVCTKCDFKGEWRDHETTAIADGWYHDDVTLFNLLTKRPGS